MFCKGNAIKTGLTILIALLLLGSGLAYLPVHRVAADDFPSDDFPSKEIPSAPAKIVPDAVIVKFKSSASLAASMEQAVTGISSVDALATQFEVKRIGKLFGNAKKGDMSRFYRVEFPEKFSVEEVREAYLQDPAVESVEVIGIHPVYPTMPNDPAINNPNDDQWNFHNFGQTPVR